jgi:PilX N-terminal
VRMEREKGVALITSLFVLLLISAIVVGMSWMVMTDQRLGGNNSSRELAFYGAEAGMEKMTTDVAQVFATSGSLTAANVATIAAAPPVGLTGVTYVNSAGASTYNLTFIPDAFGNPATTNASILPPSPYAGMQGLITPFTMTVAAQNSSTGAEVKLTRQVQVVAIPVFQFGIYSDSDLSFFNGPPFGFGGRTHTNGNLWLTPNQGPTFLGDKVTVVGQVIRTNLENGFAVTGAGATYGGDITIALAPDPTMANEPGGAPYTNASWRQLGIGEGSVTGNSVYGAVSNTLNNPTWTGTVVPAYHGQLQNGVPVLSLTSTALGGITPISLIRRPVPGELGALPATFAQRLFSQATLRILIDDYPTPTTVPGSAAACHTADMMSLDTVTTGTDPIDLATLGYVAGSPLGITASPAWYAGNFPLPVSGANATYTPSNTTAQPGYWLKNGYPIITGCIKIEYQVNPGGAWVDYTKQILALGLTGKNINPTTGVLAPLLPSLPGAQVAAQGPSGGGVATVACTNPSGNAIIRLARVRDNLDTASASANGCGNITAATVATDFWPNVLYDTREGVDRAPAAATSTPFIAAGGVMNYVELDAKNLVNWFTANQAGLGLDNNTGYTLYFSDRRGERVDTSVAPNVKTGSFGYNDIINPNDPANGCSNLVPDPGEDFEGDGILRTYGGAEMAPATILPANYMLTTAAAPVAPASTVMWTGANATSGNLIGATIKVGLVTYSGGLFANANCAGLNPNRPDVTYGNAQEARENPPVFFRRALKIVDGASLTIGVACSGTDGLSVVAENPVYIQGDYNAPVDDGTWGGVSVAAAVEGDAVTFLSNNWNDVNSFAFPFNTGNRNAAPTAYRAAIISGKGIPFPSIAGQAQDFGTDGGVHNFLRFLENWGLVCHYRGSMVSFYYNRQAVGTYKGTGVYSPPSPRDYTFDTNFTLGPACLPPRTPSLRSVNTIGFSQEILPTQ